MSCLISPDDRPAYIQKIVRESIKSLCPVGTTVTQDTALGQNGLGHGNDRRKQYYQVIKSRLAENGCAMKTLIPDSFMDSKLVRVRDVSAKVLADLV